MSRPNNPTCDGDCLHCTHDDCDSGTFSGGRRTPFEREQSAIRQEKAARAKAEAARRKAIEEAFVAWKRRNGILGYERNRGDSKECAPTQGAIPARKRRQSP